MPEGLNLSINIKAQTETAGLTALLDAIKKLGVNVDELEPEVATLSTELDELSKQQKVVNQFVAIQDAIDKTQKSLDDAKNNLRGLTTELNAADNPSQQLINSFKQTSNEVIKLESALARQKAQLNSVGTSFTSVGLEANSLSNAQSRIAESSSTLSTKLTDVKKRLDDIAKSAADQKAVDDALKTLGIDAEQLATGITKTERSFIDAFRTISTSAKSTEEQLRTALITTLNGIQTPQALQKLDQELKNLAASGRLTAEQIEGLRTVSARPIQDPTSELRTGAHATAGAMGELRQAVVGFLAINAFQRFVTETVASSREASAALKGLESIANATGVGISRAYDEASKIAASGIMSIAEASQSLQNLLSRGYNIEQAVQTINRLTDAAAFNRQAHLKWGEAVVGATAGLKNENSELVDNAGVTKNVSVIWKEYADQIGKSVDDLTKQEKIQAEVNGVLRETEMQVGNAGKAMQGFEGDLARINKSISDASIAIGKNLTPALEVLATGMAGMTEFVKPAIAGWDKLVISIGYSIDKFLALSNGLIHLQNPTQEINSLTQAYKETLSQIDEQFQSTTASITANTAALDEQALAQKSAALAQAQAAEDVQNAIKSLGVSIAGVNSAMTKTELDAVASLTTIANSANATGTVLSSSLYAALQKIESSVGLVKFREQLDAIVNSGRVTGVELENLTRLQAAVNDTIGKGAYSLDAFRGGLENLKTNFESSIVASDAFGQSLKALGIDAEEFATGIDAKFREIVGTLQDLAISGKLAGDALSEALGGAIKTADTRNELTALDALIRKLGQDGKISGSEMTLALDSVADKLREIKAETDPVEQAFARLGVTSSAALKQAAQDATDAFDVIRNSGTASVGDLNAAFAAMAEKVMAAGAAAGPVGLAMAEAFLKAKAATAEQIAEVEKLINTYRDVGTAAQESSQQMVSASNDVASALDLQGKSIQNLSDKQTRLIENYNDLNESGKEWADSLIEQAIATDNARAGTAAYQDVTGNTINSIEALILQEEDAAKAVNHLKEQFDDGEISARSLKFQLQQLVYQLRDPMTSAGASAAKTIKELMDEIERLQAGGGNNGTNTNGSSGTTSNSAAATNVNISIGGLIDLQDATLDALARKLNPYFKNIIRRSA